MGEKLTKKFISNQQKKLQMEKEKTKAQIETIKKDDPFQDPDRVSDNAAVDTEVREQDYHHIIEAKINDLEKRSKDIDIALTKIVKGKYGYCEKCNQIIPTARLELLPEARYCVADENKLRK